MMYIKNQTPGLARAIKVAMLTLLFLSSAALLAESGRDIMKRVRDQGRKHKTVKSDVYMKIVDAKKKKRERYFSNKKKIKGNKSNSIVKFYKPASVKGTALLTISDERSADNKQWIYLPALRSLSQLSASDKNKSFMGSDFTNADIAGRELDRDRHKFVKTAGDYHYVTSIPKKKNDNYSRLEVKVHSKTSIVTEVVFYDRKGKKLKTLKNKKIKKVKGMYMVTHSVVQNHRSKGSTSLKVSNIKVGHSISDNDVGIKGLRN